jgi:hypothetical protein
MASRLKVPGGSAQVLVGYCALEIWFRRPEDNLPVPLTAPI